MVEPSRSEHLHELSREPYERASISPRSPDDTYANAPSQPRTDFSRSGKWLIFCSPEYHDEVWAKIRTATEAGKLGISAKTAPPDDRITPAQRDALKRLFPKIRFGHGVMTCVYTYDFHDLEDVRRVLAELRKLGFSQGLSYKTDADTLGGIYDEGASTYVSPSGSLDFEDRRSR